MALLGAILVDSPLMDVAIEHVRADDFYAHTHETIFQTITDLHEARKPIDKVSVAELLRSRGQLERCGGPSYLSSLMESVQTVKSAEHYAKVVHEKATLRRLIHASIEIDKIARQGEEDVDGALDAAEATIFAIRDRNQHGAISSVNELLKPAFERIEYLSQLKGKLAGLPTGFPDIDRLTSGLQNANLVLLAARPGMGKTSFALNAAQTIATYARSENAGAVAFFSLEMSKGELMQRMIATEAALQMVDVNRGSIGPRDWERISEAMSTLNDLPLFIDDTAGLTVNEIRARCRRLQTRAGLSAIFVDFIQLVRPSIQSRSVRTASNRNEELSDISRSLKLTAKELNVPVVALSQLNRAIETRADKRPVLSDLRDSGSLEQDADLVAFLYHDTGDDDPTRTEFIVAKHRNGPTDSVFLRFQKEHTRFVSYAQVRQGL